MFIGFTNFYKISLRPIHWDVSIADDRERDEGKNVDLILAMKPKALAEVAKTVFPIKPLMAKRH